MTTLLTVADLTVAFGQSTVVNGVSFTVDRGECLALVGESGSGKSVTTRTLVGLAGPAATVRAGELSFDGRDLTRLAERDWRRIRGARIGLVLQDALVSLDPLRRVGDEVGETLKLHTTLNRAERVAKVHELLASVGVPEPEVRALQYPHQLSGGLRQRALIASAIACGPDLVLADEPTTALDATVAVQVLDLLASLKTSRTGLLMVSHDLAVVARLADRVAVMRDGRIVETGPTARILGDPQHPYTKALLAAVPSTHAKGTRLSSRSPSSPSALTRPDGAGRAAGQEAGRAAGQEARWAAVQEAGREAPRVEVIGLRKAFPGPDGEHRPAVRDVSFILEPGRTLGIVGESGSGKTTTARLLLGLEAPDAGEVLVGGRPLGALPRAQRRALQFIYQDPLSSFDPRYPVGRVLGEALAVAGVRRGPARLDRTVELLELVSLDSSYLRRRPLSLSGGQRQRVAIARALAAEPAVLVCDEPVSALDVSVQAQILDLLADLQQALRLSYVFISHDLGVVYHVADDVLVMRAGTVVDSGDVHTVLRRPTHSYTRELLAAIPRLDHEADHLPVGVK